MSTDPRKRQKQLARKAAKASAKAKAYRASKAQKAPMTSGFPLSAQTWPIHEALISESVRNNHLGTVMLSRRSGESIALAVFLVDTGCMGIKSAFGRVMEAAAYGDFLTHFRTSENFIASRPECLRKLVEEALAYAENLGFSPDPDYHRVKLLFGDIDTDACAQEFEFGKDGKPFYVSSPHDSPGRSRAILKQLGEKCGGSDGFHFMIASPVFHDDFTDHEE
jgi:hypothetical protein